LHVSSLASLADNSVERPHLDPHTRAVSGNSKLAHARPNVKLGELRTTATGDAPMLLMSAWRRDFHRTGARGRRRCDGSAETT
jgi:hypothetical protein